MAQRIAGQGQSLPLPQALYPAYLTNTPSTPPGNHVALGAGDAMVIPAGPFGVASGGSCVLQYNDPVTQTWRTFAQLAPALFRFVQSDGVNIRVANLTGCPIAAVVTTIGTTYTQAGTTVSVSSGNSTWYPVVGGLLTLTSITKAGGNYLKPPQILIPPPPSSAPGVGATAVGALSGGTVSTITVVNQGAGYTSGLTVSLLPDPTDPNIGSITIGTAVFGTTGAGGIAAVLCTNPGQALSAIPTLTISGGDGAARATPVWMQTILTATMTAAGAGYTGDSGVITVGGRTAATESASVANPSVDLIGYIPRMASMVSTVGGTLSTVTTVSIIDSGLFTGTPKAVLIGGAVTTVASITLGMGGAPDTVVLQPL